MPYIPCERVDRPRPAALAECVTLAVGSDVEDGDEVANSARLACESKDENFGERFIRAAASLLADVCCCCCCCW